MPPASTLPIALAEAGFGCSDDYGQFPSNPRINVPQSNHRLRAHTWSAIWSVRRASQARFTSPLLSILPFAARALWRCRAGLLQHVHPQQLGP